MESKGFNHHVWKCGVSNHSLSTGKWESMDELLTVTASGMTAAVRSRKIVKQQYRMKERAKQISDSTSFYSYVKMR